MEAVSLKCLCGGGQFKEVFTYTRPPKVEIRFQFSSGGNYYRKVFCCRTCGHYLSVHDMDAQGLYSGDYVNSNYKDEEGIRRAFEKIVSLDPEKSDNRGRVRRILEFASGHLGAKNFKEKRPTVLDIGSGLCVFLHAMKEAGWEGTALDPDLRSARHAENVVGVRALREDFMKMKPSPEYDLVSFNKVLEHVENPVAMLEKSLDFMKEDAFVYVEVPDGELASLDGPEREEFAIDHPHIFSLTSLSILAARAGFYVRRMGRLKEPSTKYTLYAFLVPARREEKS